MIRDAISSLSPYIPGEQPEDEGGYIKLNTNENPYPPSPLVVERIREVLGDSLRLYPDPTASRLREKIGESFGLDPSWIVIGNGSDELLGMAFRAFVDPGDEVLYPYPSYSLYPILATIYGAKPSEVELAEDFSLPDDLGKGTESLILIANPNSPTGTGYSPERIDELCERSRGVIVVDEAYADFSRWNCLELVRRRENLILLRSMSKSYSLAGLRVGFAIGNPKLIEAMVKVKDSYNVDRLALIGAEAAISDREWMKENVRKIVLERERMREALSNMGFYVFPSEANFLLVRVPDGKAKWLYERLKEMRILVRYFGMRRIDDCIRITVGRPEENEILLKAIGKIISFEVERGGDR